MRPTLVVEDDPDLQRAIVKAAGTLPVHLARTGEEALRTFSREHGLVLLDYRLPDMTGLDVLRRLRAKSRVPVVLFSAARDAGLEEAALAAGANAWVAKPDDPAAFQECVRTLLRYWVRVSRSPA